MRLDLPQHVEGADEAVVGLQRLEHRQGGEDGGVVHLCGLAWGGLIWWGVVIYKL